MVDVMAETNEPYVPEDWYARSFGELYPLLYRHRDDESAAAETAAFVRTLALDQGDRVADICCGGGRHLAAMRDLGLDAWGMDLSETLLQAAAERPELRGRLVRADLRAIPFHSASFDAAVNLFTSFGYFLDDADNEAALQQMAAVVRSGGKLLVDVMNPRWLRRTLEPYSRRQIAGLTVENERRIVNGRVVNKIRVHEGEAVRTFTESVRLYEADAFIAMFERAGLGDVQLVGTFAGDTMTDDSPRMIGIGVRR